MSTGAVLTLAAVALTLVIAGMFVLVRVLDLAELRLRRLVAEVRAARKALRAAGEMAIAVERDAEDGRVALARLEALKRDHQAAEEN